MHAVLEMLSKYISQVLFDYLPGYWSLFLFAYRENHEQEKQSLNSIAENTVAMEVT